MVNLRITFFSEENSIFYVNINDVEYKMDLIDQPSNIIQVRVPEDSKIAIYNKFADDDIEDPKLWQKVIAICFLWFLVVFSVIERWYIPYIVSENATINTNIDADLFVSIHRSNPDTPPICHIVSDKCTIQSRLSSIYVDINELDKQYSERKKALNIFCLIPTIICVGGSIFSILFSNVTTAIFLGIIGLLVFCAYLISNYSLKNKWLLFKSK